MAPLRISTLTIHDPTTPRRNPLNPLTQPIRSRLIQEISTLSKSSDVIILTSSPNFSVGMDITEFDSAMLHPTIHSVAEAITSTRAITVAFIEGMAFGGGLELALCCDYILCGKNAQLALPEVKIGVFPGCGGTQRLPRVCGVDRALEVICSGRVVGGKEAREVGIVDAILSQKELQNWISGKDLKKRVWRELSVMEVQRSCADFRKRLPSVEQGGEAVHAAVSSISNCWKPLREGLQNEAELFSDLILNSDQGRARRHLFFSERKATKVSGKSVGLKKESKIGVIGGGTMGRGIALSFLLKGFRNVWLVDVQPKALDVAKQQIVKTLEGRRVSPSGLSTSSSLQDLRGCDFVVEAVFENLDVKRSIVSDLNSILAKDCILVSNTSTLSIQSIFTQYQSPPKTCGMHFFSPAHIMPLVEIVRSPSTSEETLHLVRSVVKQLGKVGVVVGDADGFVGNRVMFPYTSECMFLLEEGCGVESVDGALRGYGFKLGPLEMSDLAGNDIGYLIRKGKGMTKDCKNFMMKRPARYSQIPDDLVSELGRVGQKALKGWYDYSPSKKKGRQPLISDEVTQFLSSYRTMDLPLPSNKIVERVLFPLVNEGFKVLEEGIASNPADIDVIYIYGYGFPVWRGGPMYWADHEIGLPYLLQKLYEFYSEFPGSDYFLPSQLLRTCVDAGVGVQEFYERGLHKSLSKL